MTLKLWLELFVSGPVQTVPGGATNKFWPEIAIRFPVICATEGRSVSVICQAVIGTSLSLWKFFLNPNGVNCPPKVGVHPKLHNDVLVPTLAKSREISKVRLPGGGCFVSTVK